MVDSRSPLEKDCALVATLLCLPAVREVVLIEINAWMDSDESNDALIDRLIKRLNGDRNVR